MIIKSFVADNVAGALKLARSELGADAVILKTRMIDERQRAAAGGKVEITACVDLPNDQPAVPKRETPNTPAQTRAAVSEYALERKLDRLYDLIRWPHRARSYPGNLSQLFTRLLDSGYPEFMADIIIRKLADRFDHDQEYAVIAAEAVAMLTGQLPEVAGEEKLMPGQTAVIIGPPGSGKTSLLGKITSYLVAVRKLPVTIGSLDHTKISAPEELETYADLLGVPHISIGREVDRAASDRAKSNQVTLIDTPGVGAGDKEATALLREKIGRLKPERIILTASALMRSEDLHDFVEAFEPCGMTDIAITMADQTTRLGGVMSIPLRFGIRVRFVSRGNRVSDLGANPEMTELLNGIVGLSREVKDDA
jgi:flagellar biosynthesis protein FlhF